VARRLDAGVSATAKKKLSLPVVWRESAALVAAYRGRLLLGLLLLMANRGASLILPASAGWVVDDVVQAARPERLWPIAAAVLGATVVQASSGFALSQILGIAAQRAINDMRARVHAHVLRLPVARFDATQSGTLISRIMSDAEGLRNLVGTGLVQLVGGAATTVVVFILLLKLNVTLTVAIVGVLIVFGLLLSRFFRVLRPLFRERQKVQGEISGQLGQVLAGVRVVKVFTAEDRLQRRFQTDTDKLFGMVRRTMTGFSGVTAVTILVLGVVGALAILIGGQALIDGRMSTGELLTYILYVGLLAAPIGQMANISTQFTEAFAGLDRIRELTEQPSESTGAAPCPRLQGRVEFEAVGFAYDAGRPVLHDISLVAEAGQTVALVGPSGSGKSTLASLVMAFIRPSAGVIRVDGHDLTQVDLRGYRRQLGVVLQDNWLLDGSVADNLRFARDDADHAALEDACRAAAALDFVRSLPNGFDTIVGERGVKLSGGQRQRLAIARALLADPRILILDEATSALDSESEAAIQQALARLRAGRTTFVIAHRLSTIRNAQQILVLEAGRIVERGTHDELLALPGTYRRLYDRQHAVLDERHINPGEELRPLG
jgi:subfamily B ATP-binding cassette protein MsbA